MYTYIVGGTVTEFDMGENGVLSWSPPVPPNGDILYYNVIITRADTGELVIRVEELYVLTIDVSKYGEINMDYNLTVRADFVIMMFKRQQMIIYTMTVPGFTAVGTELHLHTWCNQIEGHKVNEVLFSVG